MPARFLPWEARGKEAGATKRVYLYDSQVVSGKKNGYTFAISGCDTSHYRVVAEPEVPDSGQRAFCSDESGMVRASADGKSATCLASGKVVEEKVPATPFMRSEFLLKTTPLLEHPSRRNGSAFLRALLRGSSQQGVANLSTLGATGESQGDRRAEGADQSDG